MSHRIRERARRLKSSTSLLRYERFFLLSTCDETVCRASEASEASASRTTTSNRVLGLGALVNKQIRIQVGHFYILSMSLDVEREQFERAIPSICDSWLTRTFFCLTGFGSTPNTGFGSTNTNTGGGLFGGGSTGFGGSGGTSTLICVVRNFCVCCWARCDWG